MPLNHQCTPVYGTRFACEFLTSNDGIVPNTITHWQNWCAAALGAGDKMKLCKGDWLFNSEIVLTDPTGWSALSFFGDGAEKSRLIGRGGTGDESVLKIPKAGSARIEGFSVHTYNTAPHGITFGGTQFAACHIKDVRALGSFSDGGFNLVGVGDSTFANCRAHAWDTSYTSEQQTFLSGRSALKLSGGSRNNQFNGCEIHCFVAGGTAIFGVGDTAQLKFNGGVYSVSTTPGQPRGFAQARFTGSTVGLIFENGVLECESIAVPTGHPLYQPPPAPPVTLAQTPSFGLHFDQGVTGLSVIEAEMHFSEAALSGPAGAIFDRVNWQGSLATDSMNNWFLKQPASSSPAITSLRNSDISCGGLRIQPAGSIDRATRLRSPGAISLYAGATDGRAVA